MPLVLAGTCDLGAHAKTMVAPELAAWVENTLSSANAEPDVIVSVLKTFFLPSNLPFQILQIHTLFYPHPRTYTPTNITACIPCAYLPKINKSTPGNIRRRRSW